MKRENEVQFKALSKEEMLLSMGHIMKDMVNCNIRLDVNDIEEMIQDNNSFYVWNEATSNITNPVQELMNNFIESYHNKYNSQIYIKSMIIFWNFAYHIPVVDVVETANEIIDKAIENGPDIVFRINFDIINIKDESSLTIIFL